MEEYDLTLEHQRDAALQTMCAADPDNVETILKDLFGSSSSNWTGWDQQFVTFVEKNRKGILLYGSIGDGWHFLLAPAAAEGFWICVRNQMTGKGFLRPQSVAALTEVAVERNFFRPPH